MNRDFKTIIVIIFFSFMLTIGIITGAHKTENIEVNAESLNNQKIEWGIQRKDNHEQPDLGAKNKELIDRYNGIALGTSDKKYIYLTFDLGYEAGYTPKILDALKENGVQGTFFVTAHYINTASDIVKRMIDEGHIVGNQLPQT